MDTDKEDPGPSELVISAECTKRARTMDAEAQTEITCVKSPEVNLHIDGQLFTVKRDVLCQHSDYFRAMFSGRFVEQNKEDIAIDVVDSTSMVIIKRYFDQGEIDLSEYTLPIIGNLAKAVSFLQITKLNKEIESALDSLINLSNWIDIMTIAQKAAYSDLERHAGSFGLVEFKQVKPEIIPDVNKLFWYLSNPYLKADTEAQVFRFGYKWVLQSKTCSCGDDLLVIIGCLDMNRVTIYDVKEISSLISYCDGHSLTTTLVKCMKYIIEREARITNATQNEYIKESICDMYEEHIYDELCALIANSVCRENLLRPIVPLWKINDDGLDYNPRLVSLFCLDPNYTGFTEYLEVADKDLWGWSMASWGATKFIQVCGECGKGGSRFMRDIKVYDTLRNTWSSYGEMLPGRRHAGVVVNGDLLFIIGGVGDFRVTQDTTIIYNLKTRTCKEGAKFPDTLQSPAVCTYYNTVYAAGHKHIYKYEDLDTTDKWIPVVAMDVTINHMVAFKEHIYCSQNFFNNLYRFRPGIDTKLQMVKMFTFPPAAFVNLDRFMLIFTRPSCVHSRALQVEMFSGVCIHSEIYCKEVCGPSVVYREQDCTYAINDISGAFSLIIEMPRDIKRPVSEFHQRYLYLYYSHACLSTKSNKVVGNAFPTSLNKLYSI